MEIIRIKGNKKYNPILTKIRVAAYVRVSTKFDLQINSFESQKKYYENKINQNENWILVDIYADEGISGTQTKKRENFLRMIKDAMSGKIDLILTKSISRFARNTVDALKYARKLKEKGIGIYFEEEGIYTLHTSTELLLTILSSVAQQESENISAHVKLGREIGMQEGRILKNKRPFGFNYNNKTKKYTINKREAKVVQIIFNYFLETKCINQTTMFLKNKKYKNYNNNTNWEKSSVGLILRNSRYIGIMETRKYIISSPREKKHIKNTGQENRYLIYDYNPKIISDEVFYKVQEILNNNIKEKSKTQFNRNIMRCGFCGCTLNILNKDTAGETLICNKMCSTKKEKCINSKSISTSIIKKVLIECLTKYLKKNINNNDEHKKNIGKKEREIILRKKSMNVESLINKKINKGKYIEINKEIDQKINSINKCITEYEEEQKRLNDKKEIEIKLYNDIVGKLDTKKNVYSLLKELKLTLIIGGFDEKDHSKPYMIRFILLNTFKKNGKRENVAMFKRFTLNNNEEFIYNVLLDYQSKHIKKMQKETDNGFKILNKKIRVRLEIVEEK